MSDAFLAPAPARAQRIVDPDGHEVDIFPLPTQADALAAILRELFEHHWDKIVFGPIVEGAAWEFRADGPPSHIGMLDGYLTVAFGSSHFHLCVGATKGTRRAPTPADLAQHRRCARAELFRRLNRAGAPNSWGLRLFNGHDEQQVTVFFPNPFLSAGGEKVLKQPDWSRLALWDEMRARYAGASEPDPFDRSSTGFRHD